MVCTPILRIDQQPTGVPYLRDPGEGHNYVNLKEDPHLIDRLPELTLDPILRNHVAYLNEPASPLETVGCESWLTSNVQSETEVYTRGSYVGTLFSDPRFGA